MIARAARIDRFIAKLPDFTFASLSNLFNKRNIRIRPTWLVTNNGLSYLSPTAKFLGHSVESWERRFEQVLKLEQDDVYVDVGACLGETVLPALVKGVKTAVAIEPHPVNAFYLRRNLAQYANAKVIQKAAWKEKAKVELFVSNSVMGHSLVDRTSKTFTVDGDTLDNMVRHADFLKVDVQGAELEVLANSKSLLKQTRKVVVETHYHGERGLASKVAKLLGTLGFGVTVTPDRIVHAQKS